MSARRRIPAVLAVVAGLLLASTAAQAQLGGILDKVKKGADTATKAADTANKAAKFVRSTFADISEEEEYYIGRSVAALILSRYQPLANPGLSQYVNTLGQAVALSSDRPETFAGYHFMVLDSDEVNALAAPGGMIFLTKGLLKRCPDEETLAVILAHEVGHVAAKHGLQSIKKSRLVDAFKLLGSAAVDKYGPAELSQLTDVFEGVLGDIAESLVERGYDRKYEYEADELGLKTALAAGYDPTGLVRFLRTMVGDKSGGSDKGWFKTHPTPEQRIDRADKATAAMGALPAILDARTARFKAATAGLK
jgi:predicted Zn-dependent protease